MNNSAKLILKFKGKTAAFVDWANVYGWRKSLKAEVDSKKLFDYLKSYKEIKSFHFYHGTDNHPKSKQFLTKIKKIGFNVFTKPVKYITAGRVDNQIIRRRKCDFDLEIALDCFENIDQFDSFIFFSGDGDFATLYQRLIKKGKQVIVVYQPGHLGKEVWEMKRGIFKVEIKRLGNLTKNVPGTKARA